jgi:hypothetical protein
VGNQFRKQQPNSGNDFIKNADVLALSHYVAFPFSGISVFYSIVTYN